MSCLTSYFSVSGSIFFLLFILHTFAYYSFRANDEPIDMLTPRRWKNKNFFLREVFKWIFFAVSLSYAVVWFIGRLSFEYDELKGMLQEDERENAHKDELALERSLSKVIPDFLSNWTIFRVFLLLLPSIALFKIQQEELEEA